MDSINSNKRVALRAAVLIHEQLPEDERQDVPICLPEFAWNKARQLQHQIDRANRHGWHRAAARLTEDLARAMDGCRRELENGLRALQSRQRQRHVASASDIYRDIRALADEFEAVDIDLHEHELSVTTDRIVLEDVGLGPFEIRLDWHLLGSPSAYRVVALDPNPAAKDEEVTHPHVQGGSLCEGEGRSAVRAALEECRLYDFFLLVSRLLHTYGRGSAYVELSDWNGIPCEDCGESMDEEDRCYCRRCDVVLCSGCSAACGACSESFCSSCLGTCLICSENYCYSCLQTCRACGKQVCENCSEDGLCQRCYETQDHEEHGHDPSEQPPSEPAAVPA